MQSDSKKTAKPTTSFIVRVPVPLAEEFQKRAIENDRTVSQELRRLIRRHVEDEEVAA